MEFKDVIYGRRSVRKFTEQKIDDATINEIMDAAIWAPSGVNLQPWYYVVIRSEEKLQELYSVTDIISEHNRAHLEERFSTHPDVVESTLNFIKALGGASTVILVFRDKPDYSYALQDEGIVQSVAASVENLLLSAWDHGIGGCWMTAPAQAHMTKELRDKFAPGHGELLCMVPLGYAQTVPSAPKRKPGKYTIV